MKIGVYDSGIGGISVLHEALTQLPKEDYIYYADTLHVPYGTKPKEEVKGYIFEAVDFMQQQQVKALVIACNTATVVAVEELRKRYSFPIIGMEPAVKPALAASRGKRVLVMATPLALKQDKFQALLKKVDGEQLVDLLPAPELVEFAEKFIFNEETILAYLKEKLQPYNLADYGTIVLGCTHFIYFKDILKKYVPEHIHVVDGNGGTVKNLKRILREKNKMDEGQGNVNFYISGHKIEGGTELENFKRLMNRIEDIL